MRTSSTAKRKSAAAQRKSAAAQRKSAAAQRKSPASNRDGAGFLIKENQGLLESQSRRIAAGSPIRDARNEALEEAASHLEQEWTFDPLEREAGVQLAAELRAKIGVAEPDEGARHSAALVAFMECLYWRGFTLEKEWSGIQTGAMVAAANISSALLHGTTPAEFKAAIANRHTRSLHPTEDVLYLDGSGLVAGLDAALQEASRRLDALVKSNDRKRGAK